MFSEKQKEFMETLGLNLDFNNLSDDDYVLIEDTVGDELVYEGLDINYEPTSIGKMCESILDLLE